MEEKKKSPTDIACADLVTGCSKGFSHRLHGVRNARAGVGRATCKTLGATPDCDDPAIANLPLVSSPMVSAPSDTNIGWEDKVWEEEEEEGGGRGG